MNYQAIIEELYGEVQSLFGQGQVADYIPALTRVDARKLGIAIETINGDSFQISDAQQRFSIQSISKAFNLVAGDAHHLRYSAGKGLAPE